METLRYYEQMGVVHPIKDESSDYRYFEIQDFTRLIDAKWLRGFDYHFTEIADMLVNGTVEEIIAIEEINRKVCFFNCRLRMNFILIFQIKNSFAIGPHKSESRRTRNSRFSGFYLVV